MRKILFVVEGDKEKTHLDKYLLKQIGIDVNEENVMIVSYKTTIYELYDLLVIKENEGKSLTSILLKEEQLKNVKANVKIDSTFSEIYLIFDYEPHYQKFENDKVKYLVTRFNDETEEGMLLFNFPMYESLYDITSLDIVGYQIFKEFKVDKGIGNRYKIESKERSFSWGNNQFYQYIYDPLQFKIVSYFNLMKYLYLIKENLYKGLDTNLLIDIEIKEMKLTNKIYTLNSTVLLYFNYHEIDKRFMNFYA